jgi:hypothetical protein
MVLLAADTEATFRINWLGSISGQSHEKSVVYGLFVTGWLFVLE